MPAVINRAKCEVSYCDEDAKCRGLCIPHYKRLEGTSSLDATAIEDWMICPIKDQWWKHLPKLSKLALKLINGDYRRDHGRIS